MFVDLDRAVTEFARILRPSGLGLVSQVPPAPAWATPKPTPSGRQTWATGRLEGSVRPRPRPHWRGQASRCSVASTSPVNGASTPRSTAEQVVSAPARRAASTRSRTLSCYVWANRLSHHARRWPVARVPHDRQAPRRGVHLRQSRVALRGPALVVRRAQAALAVGESSSDPAAVPACSRRAGPWSSVPEASADLAQARASSRVRPITMRCRAGIANTTWPGSS